MSTAQDAVMSMPELLEHIFEHMQLRELLLTASLVCKTWQAITLTPRLQRSLFFQPSIMHEGEPLQNPFLARAFPLFFSAEFTKAYEWTPAPADRDVSQWRRMLVRQPPVRIVRVEQTCYGRRGEFVRHAELHNLELRMGTLYELVLAFLDNVEAFRFVWHNSDIDAGKEDLTFIVRGNDAWGFYSDDRYNLCTEDGERVEIPFEEWERSKRV
ncbi:hypothetical protein DFH06DRAFT_618567 [Mycena polygramma]|nr:hypothetical protein DFH06DRAFT_618567 [Mycena polygramma]